MSAPPRSRSPTSSRSSGAPPSRSPTTRNGSKTSAAAASSCATSVASTATRSPTSPRTRSRRGARLEQIEGYEARAHASSKRSAASSNGRRSTAVDRAVGRPPGRGGTAQPSGGSAPPRAGDAERDAWRSQIEAGEATEDGTDRVTFLLAPNPGESPRPARPGRVRRRALARDAGGARRADGRAPDARVRRSRRGHRRRGRYCRRTLARDTGCTAPGAVCHASRASGGICRHAGRGGEDRGPEVDETDNRERTHRGHRRDRRRRRAGGRAVADARRGRRLVARPPPRRRAARDRRPRERPIEPAR